MVQCQRMLPNDPSLSTPHLMTQHSEVLAGRLDDFRRDLRKALGLDA
jgi:hypothetical protein